MVIFALCAVAAGLLGFNLYRQRELRRRSRNAAGRPRTFKSAPTPWRSGRSTSRRASTRCTAESEKAPNDPEVLKALGARRLALVKEDQALKDDLDRVQRDLDAIKR